MITFTIGTLIGICIGIPVGGIGSFWLHRRNRAIRKSKGKMDGDDYA